MQYELNIVRFEEEDVIATSGQQSITGGGEGMVDEGGEVGGGGEGMIDE